MFASVLLRVGGAVAAALLAMTAAALRSSWRRGATRASLDASDSGAALYRRLRFTAVAQITQFSCPR